MAASEDMPPSGLSDGQVRALDALASGAGLEAAAAAAGVSERTLRRWRHQMRFRQVLRIYRRDVFANALEVIRSGMTSAALALRAVADDPQAPAQARVNAARVLLDVAMRAGDLCEAANDRQDTDLLMSGLLG